MRNACTLQQVAELSEQDGFTQLLITIPQDPGPGHEHEYVVADAMDSRSS
jgi:hypothetical protein